MFLDDGSKSGSLFGCPDLASESTEKVINSGVSTPAPGANVVAGGTASGANLISLSVPNLSSGTAQVSKQFFQKNYQRPEIRK